MKQIYKESDQQKTKIMKEINENLNRNIKKSDKNCPTQNPKIT